MSTWLIAIIIIVVIAFIIGTMTALLKQGGFHFPEGYENPEETKHDESTHEETKSDTTKAQDTASHSEH